MSIYNAKPHHGMVAEYQASGTPFVTSSIGGLSTSAIKVEFPYVTRWVIVKNPSTDDNTGLRFGFTRNGIMFDKHDTQGSNFFVLDKTESTGRMELKCRELWFIRHSSADTGYSIVAGLTNIKNTDFPWITGSNGVEGVG